MRGKTTVQKIIKKHKTKFSSSFTSLQNVVFSFENGLNGHLIFPFTGGISPITKYFLDKADQ